MCERKKYPGEVLQAALEIILAQQLRTTGTATLTRSETERGFVFGDFSLEISSSKPAHWASVVRSDNQARSPRFESVRGLPTGTFSTVESFHFLISAWPSAKESPPALLW
jgi:hypothetical protein